jgi:hypothetical protein
LSKTNIFLLSYYKKTAVNWFGPKCPIFLFLSSSVNSLTLVAVFNSLCSIFSPSGKINLHTIAEEIKHPENERKRKKLAHNTETEADRRF